jgi:hypothetical protein
MASKTITFNYINLNIKVDITIISNLFILDYIMCSFILYFDDYHKLMFDYEDL